MVLVPGRLVGSDLKVVGKLSRPRLGETVKKKNPRKVLGVILSGSETHEFVLSLHARVARSVI